MCFFAGFAVSAFSDSMPTHVVFCLAICTGYSREEGGVNMLAARVGFVDFR